MKRIVRNLVLPLLLLFVACSADPSKTEPQNVLTATSADGLEIRYAVHGDGPIAVVLIHGWLEDREFWREQIVDLAEQHTVVAIDLPGHGESIATRADRTSWSVDSFASDLSAVVEQLPNEQIILVGHSMGGQVALAAAERLGQVALGVVGVDSLHNAEMSLDAASWDPILEMYREDFSATCEQFVASMFPHATDEPTLPDWVQRRMCASDPEIALAVAERFPQIDHRSLFGRAALPIRCINSPLTLPTESEINRQYADFEVRTIDGAGHFLMLERPAEFNLLLAETIEELTGS